ncbi:MAG: dihydroneopterin aldolase, partial [Terrimicrobiaceae bacterium]
FSLFMDAIIIKGLEVDAFIGVSDGERTNSQRLRIDAILTPLTQFSALNDDITRTVDYQAATQRIVSVVASRPRRLIETLASDIAGMLVGEFAARRAEVEVRKFVLPGTDYVAVHCTRDRQPP